MLRIISFSLLSTAILGAIGLIFWQQELQYVGPTPQPADYRSIEIGTPVDISDLKLPTDKPLFIHFYNYDCPCSRFNATEFRNMVIRYKDEISFLALVQSSQEDTQAKDDFIKKYDLGIPVKEDVAGKLAERLGVYSTPQAVIIKDNEIVYRGNYNKARFCTSRNTKFAEMALQAIIDNEPIPVFPEIAYTAYGCELPSNTSNQNALLNFFEL